MGRTDLDRASSMDPLPVGEPTSFDSSASASESSCVETADLAAGSEKRTLGVVGVADLCEMRRSSMDSTMKRQSEGT